MDKNGRHSIKGCVTRFEIILNEAFLTAGVSDPLKVIDEAALSLAEASKHHFWGRRLFRSRIFLMPQSTARYLLALFDRF